MSRLVLVTMVVGIIAVINAAGVYAQLVAAHVGDRGAAAASIESQDAALAARIARSPISTTASARSTRRVEEAIPNLVPLPLHGDVGPDA